MFLRSILISALAVIMADASLVQAQEGADYRPHRRHHQHSRRSTEIYRSHGVGGQRYGDDHTPYIYKNGPYSNSPYFDNRTFWERVETQPDYPVR